MKRALILFAKAPERHNVKTRLSEHMSDEERLELYIALLDKAIDKLRSIKEVETLICYTPSDKREYFGKYGLKTFPQSDGDLGERMFNALVHVFKDGFDSAIIVGVDIPDLSEKIIENAFDLLMHKDIVFGPAIDGGYYLVGMSKPVDVVFRDIDWSTDRTLQQSIAVAESHGYTVAYTDTLSDIDTIDDVRRAGYL
ncbi:MAG: TIGR04282 family arsenosugar biosynthesis glycosyltransferase [Thermodesulfovibrionales bacterium]